MYMTERADFGLQALRSLAEPVASTRWEIFFHRTQLPVFQRVCGHYLLCSVTLLTQRLHPHFVGQRHLTHIISVLKRVLYKNYQNSLTIIIVYKHYVTDDVINGKLVTGYFESLTEF